MSRNGQLRPDPKDAEEALCELPTSQATNTHIFGVFPGPGVSPEGSQTPEPTLPSMGQGKTWPTGLDGWMAGPSTLALTPVEQAVAKMFLCQALLPEGFCLGLPTGSMPAWPSVWPVERWRQVGQWWRKPCYGGADGNGDDDSNDDWY